MAFTKKHFIWEQQKTLWQNIKPKWQDHTGISTITVNGTVISNSISKAELLNQHFKYVFTIEETNNLTDKEISPYPAISNVEIMVPGIYNLLLNCNRHKSSCSDNVHNYVLWETAADIAPLLTHLFQQSLSTGILSNDWKKALVNPIFKKGEKSDPKTYWPVFLKWSKKQSVCFTYFCSLQNHGTSYSET